MSIRSTNVCVYFASLIDPRYLNRDIDMKNVHWEYTKTTMNMTKNLIILVFLRQDNELESTSGGISGNSSQTVPFPTRPPNHIRDLFFLDIWWLVWGVFIISIIERDQILNPDKPWFDLFRILFELVSAFGGIGLSLGLPTVRYALSHVSVLYG